MTLGCIEEGDRLIEIAKTTPNQRGRSREADPELTVQADRLAEVERLGPEDRPIAYEPASGSGASKSPCFSPIR